MTRGLTVSNIYFNQPLLPSIARGFGIGDHEAELAVTLSQVGHALGNLGIVPLRAAVGPRPWTVERRSRK